MSLLAVQGGATGTGTVTLLAPVTNTNRTLTLPDQTATVITDSAAILNIGSGQVYKDASGNVGVGTSSPTAKLTVVTSANSEGEIRLGDNATFYGSLRRVNATDELRLGNYGGSQNLTFYTVASERMRISSAGIVTMSAYGVGTATFSAAGVISSVSDETWKIKDGIPVDPDFMLKKLTPGYWYYNDEKKNIFGADRQLGFYAQNVNAAIGPEAAPPPEEGKPWGYYDRSVLAVTVMSLQKALATIESLTARIAALEATA